MIQKIKSKKVKYLVFSFFCLFFLFGKVEAFNLINPVITPSAYVDLDTGGALCSSNLPYNIRIYYGDPFTGVNTNSLSYQFVNGAQCGGSLNLTSASQNSANLSGFYYFTASSTTGVNPVYFTWYFDGTSALYSTGQTRISTIVPYNGQTLATSTHTTVGATGFLEYNDLNDYSVLEINIQNSNQAFLQCADVSCAGLSHGAISLDFEYPLLTATGFSYSSSTQTLPVGKYYVTTKIRKGSYCLFGYCAGMTTIVSTSTTFIISTTTKADNLKDNANEYLDTLTESGTTFEDCSVTSFDFFTCMSDLIAYAFVPTPDAIDYIKDQLYNGILTHFPLGYFTDFISIMATSSVGSLTVLDATVPTGVAGAGSNITLDFTGVLDFILYSTSTFSGETASSTVTFYDYTNTYWKIIVYLMAFFYILSRIIGKQFHPKIK